MMRFFIAWLVLGIGLLLQISLVYHGIVIDFAFAALIASALVLSFEEVISLALFSGFFLNWRGSFDLPILVIVLYPLAVVVFQKFFRWQGWFGLIASTAVGFLFLAFSEYAHFFSLGMATFGLDLIVGTGFGVLTFWLLRSQKIGSLA
jgi:hypothetical protein